MALRTGELISNTFKRCPGWKTLDDEQLAHLKRVLGEISDDFISVCNSNGLTYTVAYGTALGVRRHSGYIPWDDDVDFYMPRKDYMRFLELADSQMGEKYYVRSIAKGDKIGVPTCHIRLKGTRYVNYGDLTLTAAEPEETRGIYIDVFPLDNASNNKVVRDIKGIVCLGIQFLMSCINVKESVDFLNSRDVVLDETEKRALALKTALGSICRAVAPLYRWNRLYEAVASSNRNEDTGYVTCYVGYKSLKKSTFKRDDLFPPAIGTFEGRAWNTPRDLDKYLQQEYGDFLKIPDDAHKRIHPIFELEFPQEQSCE